MSQSIILSENIVISMRNSVYKLILAWLKFQSKNYDFIRRIIQEESDYYWLSFEDIEQDNFIILFQIFFLSLKNIVNHYDKHISLEGFTVIFPVWIEILELMSKDDRLCIFYTELNVIEFKLKPILNKEIQILLNDSYVGIYSIGDFSFIEDSLEDEWPNEDWILNNFKDAYFSEIYQITKKAMKNFVNRNKAEINNFEYLSIILSKWVRLLKKMEADIRLPVEVYNINHFRKTNEMDLFNY